MTPCLSNLPGKIQSKLFCRARHSHVIHKTCIHPFLVHPFLSAVNFIERDTAQQQEMLLLHKHGQHCFVLAPVTYIIDKDALFMCTSERLVLTFASALKRYLCQVLPLGQQSGL